MANIRVLIADDESLVRRALTVFLSDADDIEVIGEATDGAHAIAAVGTLRPDVVLMDLQMPGTGGVEATTEIVTRWPHTRVLAVTTFGTIDTILPVLRAGASGYLLKDTEPEDIITAVRNVYAGSGALSPRVTQQLISSIQRTEESTPEMLPESERLSDREVEVVRHLATGMSNSEIAAAMHVAEGTIKAHLGAIMRKWYARDRVQVLVRAARAGIISFH